MSSSEPTQRGVRFTEPEHDKSQPSAPDDRLAAADPTMDAPDLPRHDSSTSGSGSSGESDPERAVGERNASDDDADGQYEFAPALSTTPRDEVPPMAAAAPYGYASRSRGGSGGAPNGVGVYDAAPNAQLQPPTMNSARPPRPSAVRTPSNAYAPQRRPQQYSLNSNSGARHRASSTNRASRRNPNAEYRAQEKAYVERIRQDAPDNDDFFNPDLRTPSLGYSTEDSETDDESPSTTDYLENDPYDQETLLYYGNDDLEPSVEELKIPENRERLEWHSMLASVLTGDVVKQEKKRLIGGSEQQGDNTIKTEIWMGVRAKCCGRTLQAQRRLIDDGRSKAKTLIEGIITFEIKGEAEVGQTAAQQVADMVRKIEKCEGLYPTWQTLEHAQPRAASAAFRESCDAVISWHNTTQLINTELSILRSWVGNDELDFSKRKDRMERDSHLTDDSSFIDRILKEDGLKSLQSKDSLLVGLNNVINKAKATLIANATAFQERHLPPYIEELLTLINFPSRLVQEIIRMRLSYAKRMKDPAQQGVMMAEQMIAQFQILLKLAIRIKESYTVVSQPEPGWDPPPCIEENFDAVVLDALKFYFKMLNWKLSANKNTFKEAEILEQEWEFSKTLGKHLEGGDVEVAEQFSYLTQKSLSRLTAHFEKELQRRPEEVAGAEMDKRYKQILDSVRVRQRKLFRFSRILTTRFENSTEYNISLVPEQVQDLFEALEMSGHFLVETQSTDNKGLYLIASPVLMNRPQDIQSLLGTCYHTDEVTEDPTNPYLLILRPEDPLRWHGPTLQAPVRTPHLDVKIGRMRLVADGAQARLANANATFLQSANVELTKIVDQRANLPRVNVELQRIKKVAYKLSNTIMDSVEIIRKQTAGLECQELIQTCFAFATEFGQRSVYYMDFNRRALNNLKLTRLALDWVSFICDDCVASDRKTFRWAVVALEFAMMMTRGQNILSLNEEEYARLRAKVAGCMSLLISHFDIMGARSTMAAQAEKQRIDAMLGKKQLDISRLKNDEESAELVREGWLEQLAEIDEIRKAKEAERQALGRVLEDSNEADRALTYLSSSATNVTLRWQQGQFIGGGTFGSVYAAINLDSNHLMAVKEIRLQDPQLIPTIVSQIRDEMGVLQMLDHPNIVSYYGIEPHRDKVYIFMEYCSGGSLAGLLEHGRIEDETVIMVYALQMLEGLAYLHESSVVHRDIKPENILLDHNGVIKFVDFGAAKVIAKQGKTLAAEHAATRQGRQKSMTGTPMYMSPEVIKGENKGRLGAVDIWSLGCVILEMATGRRPWASLDNEWAIMYNIAQGNPPQLPTRDQLSDQGIDFLRACFERDPGRRATAAELLQHPWIMILRSQLSLEPQTPQTPLSETSSGSGSLHASRQNTMS
ncbi:MAP kinase kinase kinase wis4 [Lasiodiplodia hormozganensis]|uniref:MAP kinase kinase kinase n=2 Tax=Lasiodiplodia TaxID=66739 RepID=A0A5N5DI62_9PEZI|nr:Map kinase kinase kinase wis4 [Lasiodiplodia theobromae]KAB2577525.1 MAP kinase kinase kinase wis4 [Lasiodiplodia theobromae]KAF4540518.1 Map kinase kinase kinase wis4 [Lasiodiplodia theobromae]KAK0660004.1 MAP kinase kinase kinase wis4 [Lasiodiplodia hormozganensis]